MAKTRLQVILFTIALNVSAVIVFANLAWSDWRTGMMLNLIDNALFITYAIIYRDRVMAQLIVFGLALGFTELIADAWLVGFTRTLDYSVGGGPMIWKSPLWMPFAWEVVAIQFAVLGGWLADRFHRAGYFLAAFIGAVNIPFYEEMAKHTNWWVYRNCHMISQTPVYIIIGEFLLVLGIVWLGKQLKPGDYKQSLICGFMGGLVIFASYAIGYYLIDFGRIEIQ